MFLPLRMLTKADFQLGIDQHLGGKQVSATLLVASLPFKAAKIGLGMSEKQTDCWRRQSRQSLEGEDTLIRAWGHVYASKTIAAT